MNEIAARQQVYGANEKKYPLVFSSTAGTPFSPRNLARAFTSLVKRQVSRRFHHDRKIVGSYRSNKKYRRVAWKCNDRYNHLDKCMVPHSDEEFIIHAFHEPVLSKIKGNLELSEICHQLTVSSIRSNKPYLLKREREQLASDFIADFLVASPKELIFDDSAWRAMINRTVTIGDRRMTMYFIDRSK